MRRLLRIALVLLFAAEALPLISVPRAWPCSCPIKSACCRLDVCPMEKARHDHDGISLVSCNGGAAHSIVPSFLARSAVTAERVALLVPSTFVREAAKRTGLRPDRDRDIDDPPPRMPPFPLA